MKRTILMMAATMALTVFLIGGVAYAASVTCDRAGDTNPAIGECRGTIEADSITGSGRGEVIDAMAGNDTVDARAGNDSVMGREGQDTIHGGGGQDSLSGGQDADTLYGDRNHDYLYGGGGRDDYFGGPGPDTIVADVSLPGDAETVSGGTGDDIIVTTDGIVDDIDCGDGHDTVDVDPIDNVSPTCESITIHL
jgi:Ca2+-binding RTX toxin-like protein